MSHLYTLSAASSLKDTEENAAASMRKSQMDNAFDGLLDSSAVASDMQHQQNVLKEVQNTLNSGKKVSQRKLKEVVSKLKVVENSLSISQATIKGATVTAARAAQLPNVQYVHNRLNSEKARQKRIQENMSMDRSQESRAAGPKRPSNSLAVRSYLLHQVLIKSSGTLY